LFAAAMKLMLSHDMVRMILLPRTKEQGVQIMEQYAQWFKLNRIFIPDKVLDGLNLIWFSDLVISAGGTMIREAAALNVPAVSIFGGHIGAVDRYLEESGRLALIREQFDLQQIKVGKRARPETPKFLDNGVMQTIVDHLEMQMNSHE
jgi:predicted glycosyltransferase